MANKQRSMAAGMVWAWLGLSTALVACGRTSGESMGGETHFLSTCATTCAEGLSCVNHVCTASCERDAECQALSSLATCRTGTGQCDVSCTRNTGCIEFDEDYRCNDGVCRLPRGGGGAPADAAEPPPASGGSSNNPSQPASGGSSTMDPGSSDAGAELRPMLPCPEGFESQDPIIVTQASIDGDALNLEVSHAGGCEEHTYVACFLTGFDTSLPVQTGIQLMHDANGDSCEAGITLQLSFDLKPLAEHYNDTFDAQGGVIATNYGLYHFGELNCDERQAAASYTLDQHLQSNTETPKCETVEDCTWRSIDTECDHSCEKVIANSVAELESAIAAVNAEFCDDFVADECGTPSLIECEGPPELACIDGVCVESE